MTSPRIISGTARGHRLRSVPGDTTRPITDRVKEALFNILSQDISGATMLDLFAGTGSVGIEALSRGASFVHFNDNARLAVETIKDNLLATKLTPLSQVTRSDAFALLKHSPDRQYDYIFIAPPQYKGLWIRALETLRDNIAWLAPQGWVIVQIDPREYQPLSFDPFVEFDQRKYGSTILVFYQVKESTSFPTES